MDENNVSYLQSKWVGPQVLPLLKMVREAVRNDRKIVSKGVE